MADIEVKSPRVLSDLTENTDTNDDDLLMVGDNGGNNVHTITFGNIVNALYNKIYPVGSIYISTTNVSPETLFGGTWEQIEDTFLLASGSTYSAGNTGGEASVTLSSSQMPSHTHSTPSHTHSIPSLSGTAASAGSHTHHLKYSEDITITSGSGARINVNGSSTTSNTGTDSQGSHTHSVTTTSSTTGSSSGTSGSTGSGSSHNNMPPYLVVYMWQRIG